MARSDGDSWEITESVGATALGVAAGRAAETESEDPLINDPFARVFLDAVGDGVWSWFFTADLPDAVIEAEPQLPAEMQLMVSYTACRTAFFDGFFLDAAQAGVNQAVILAAGLDSRAWRLPWPDGTTVYELDQIKVLDFKVSTLAGHGAEPSCDRIGVAVDLRDDWPAALRRAGFDPSARSAWSVEGLLPYLPAAAHELLFERIQGLSAAGSRIAVEAHGPGWMDPDLLAQRQERGQRLRGLIAKADPDRQVPATQELWYLEEREDVGSWLSRHGWQATVTPARELMAGYGRGVPDGIEDPTPRTLFVAAVRS
ncbi:class I SAM-dependent methyltransferase [Mycobacterium vicinigordonae]|uniref:S-adenosyl-L-methionine-dependent methyltransferase n=1 Tax=Mycobacterium vicinigordonae TaxID=1719132 RepID=A0A7D6I222_9MYCO|nr:class I SAM-dependent methyltransferase [Mycobacterium vicinigordonae]QLL08274.1 class I SAM-dependent methyltransferase [Mycobacterium vicinigordonae]